jgi:8-oxo-(d)GTP phosphatase
MSDVIAAAGAVVWRPSPGDRAGSASRDDRADRTAEVALVHRPRYDDWSLPKGKLDPGESCRMAAVREVAEETGFRVALGRYLGQTRYEVPGPAAGGPAAKVVTYYAARAVAGAFEPGDEVDELRWLPPEEALSLLSYRHDQRILAEFTALPHDTTTLLLLRHAKAGRRAEWTGPDARRPLSENGHRQLPGINTLSALYGVTRVYSAPLVRCVDTVRALADTLGVPVVEEPLMSEEGYVGNEDAAVARLLEIAGAGGTPLVCSQGGVIPDLMSRVAGTAGLAIGETGDIASKKGSIWALFFTSDTKPHPLAADYIPRP